MPKNPKHFSPKQLATHNRQRCINLLEKIMKNLFRMFRKPETTSEQLTERFFHLKKQLDDIGFVALNTAYHREMKVYVENLSSTLSSTEFNLDDIRSENMTQLNRIQKVKNSTGYKREKKHSLRENRFGI